MNHFETNSVMNFGKFKNQRIDEIVMHSPDYLVWCIANVDFFYVSEETMQELIAKNPAFKLTQEAAMQLETKRNSLLVEEEYYEEAWDDEETYDNYEGSYAQDIEGYSDDDIDDVFGGDPDAYWNID